MRVEGVVDPRGFERWAGGLSLAAGAIHGGVAPQHFAEWWGYGAFFVVAATAQVVYGLALLVGVTDPERPLSRSARRALYAAGIAGNVLVIGLYVVTRTTGIPFFGPEAGVVETVAPVDVVSKTLEVALVLVLGRLLALRET